MGHEMTPPRAVKHKWCVTLNNDGWGYYLHPYRGEQDHGPETDTYETFSKAKKACLEYFTNHLIEVRSSIAEIKRKKMRDYK